MGFVRVPERFGSISLRSLRSKFDPCLFIGPYVMCIVYVDNLIFWSNDIANIDTRRPRLCPSKSRSRLVRRFSIDFLAILVFGERA
jgi:hypothetical protein